MDGDMRGAAAVAAAPLSDIFPGLDQATALRVAHALAAFERPEKARLSQSVELGALMQALAKAQAHMTSPRRNRTVTVKSRRTQTSYNFSYSTLDVICDMIREPLADASIAVTHQHIEVDKRPGILTRIWLGEQYLGSWMPLVLAPDWSVQDLGGASSYCMRYNLRALLNIASEEDNDGNSAAGNDYVYRDIDATGGSAVNMTDEQKLLFAHERMLKASESVRMDDRAAGVQLLKLWQDRMERFETLREDKPGYWSKLLDRVSAALSRAFGLQYGASFAWVWQKVADVTTVAERNSANAEYIAKHMAAVIELKKQTPQAYGLLMEHIRYFSGKVDQLEAVRLQKERDAADLAAEIEAVEARAAKRAVSTDPEPEGFMVAAPKQLPAPADAGVPLRLEDFCYVIDHTGDIASDGFQDRVAFAKAYLAQWRATGKADRAQLNENNGDSLSWAGSSGAAAAILEELQDPPTAAPGELLDGDDIPTWDDKPLRVAAPVDIPRNSRGSIDCLRYLSAIQDSIAAICDVPSMTAWLAANEPAYAAEGFPVGTRTKILAAVMARKRALGIQPDNG